MTVYGHNIIYGGWGNGVVHGGPGNSAISGAEAPTLGYTDNFNMYGIENAVVYMTTQIADTVLTDYVLNKVPVETDFFHPYNPGNPAPFIPTSAPPPANSAPPSAATSRCSATWVTTTSSPAWAGCGSTAVGAST